MTTHLFTDLGSDHLNTPATPEISYPEHLHNLDDMHLRNLDDMILQGWGDVNQNEIPSDWRERRGPSLVELVRARNAGEIDESEVDEEIASRLSHLLRRRADALRVLKADSDRIAGFRPVKAYDHRRAPRYNAPPFRTIHFVAEAA